MVLLYIVICVTIFDDHHSKYWRVGPQPDLVLVSIKIDLGLFSWATGDMPPMLNPVNFLHSSALALMVFELKRFDIFSIETNLSPDTKQR